MVDQVKFCNEQQVKSFDDRVQEAFLAYCELRGKYPHVIGVSLWHIDYKDPILETRLDRSLGPADFWLSAK